MMEIIKYRNKILAVVIRKDFSVKGIKFFSKKKYSQQLGYMKRQAGYEIKRHIHNINKREIFLTQEVLFIRKGIILVTLYNRKKEYAAWTTLATGDIIHLIDGGHGINFLTEAEIIEVKQGPYSGKKDKTRF